MLQGPVSSSPADILDRPQEEWSPVRWAVRIWTWIVLIVVFLLLEALADPIVASLAVCLKLGWRDLLAAIVLRRDANASRGKGLGFYCLGYACFKVAGAGVLLAAGVIAAELALGRPFVPNQFIAGLCLLTGGIYTGVAAIMGAILSSRAGIRLWLDKTIYENLFKRGRPLRCHGKRNRVPWLLVSGLLLSSALFFVPIIVGVVWEVVVGNKDRDTLIGAALALATWIWVTWKFRQAWRHVASTPSECWPEAAPEETPSR